MINQQDTRTYDQMYKAFQEGKITEQQWSDFCMEMLSKIMKDHKDIFIRLKNRG